jgi:hypothetical protein
MQDATITEVALVEQKWKALLQELCTDFGDELDIQAVLFIIGLQELGFNHRKFTKDQKVDIMHIAICTLLKPYGYYNYIGRDDDQWPHYEPTDKLPHLKPGQQLHLMKESIITYFGKITE